MFLRASYSLIPSSKKDVRFISSLCNLQCDVQGDLEVYGVIKHEQAKTSRFMCMGVKQHPSASQMVPSSWKCGNLEWIRKNHLKISSLATTHCYYVTIQPLTSPHSMTQLAQSTLQWHLVIVLCSQIKTGTSMNSFRAKRMDPNRSSLHITNISE